MKNIIRTFLSGALVVVPLAITLTVLYSVAEWLDKLGARVVKAGWELLHPGAEYPPDAALFPGGGALLLIACIYLAGMLTRLWAFRSIWGRFERLLARVPGVKIVYESVRDLIKLFGGGSGSMRRAVEYRPPGAEMGVLGIVTSEQLAEDFQKDGPKRVAVYLPLAYMLGGPTILTAPENLRPLSMSVEEALKLAATAHVGGAKAEAPRAKVAAPKQTLT